MNSQRVRGDGSRIIIRITGNHFKQIQVTGKRFLHFAKAIKVEPRIK